MAMASRYSAIISRKAVSSLPISRIKAPPVRNSTLLTTPSSSSSPLPRAPSRFAYVMGSLETMLPQHSAIASSRLKSNIAMDTTCWSWLSRDFAVPR